MITNFSLSNKAFYAVKFIKYSLFFLSSLSLKMSDVFIVNCYQHIFKQPNRLIRTWKSLLRSLPHSRFVEMPIYVFLIASMSQNTFNKKNGTNRSNFKFLALNNDAFNAKQENWKLCSQEKVKAPDCAEILPLKFD